MEIRLGDASDVVGTEVRRLFGPYAEHAPPVGRASGVGEPWMRLEARSAGFALVADRPLAGRASPEFVGPGLPEVLSVLEYHLFRLLVEPLTDLVHLHASGAVGRGGALVAVGRSGAGKSSLALAWASAGRPILGDDLVAVDDRGLARGFPRLLKVDRRRLEAHGIPLQATVAPDQEDPEAWLDPSQWEGGWATEVPRPVRILALVAYRADAGLHVEELPASEGLRALLDHTLDSGRPPASALDPLIRVLDGCRVMRVTFDDAIRAAAVLGRLADSTPRVHDE